MTLAAQYDGKLVRLRPFTRADAETYRSWVNDPEIAALIDRAGTVTHEEHERWYDNLEIGRASCRERVYVLV